MSENKHPFMTKPVVGHAGAEAKNELRARVKKEPFDYEAFGLPIPKGMKRYYPPIAKTPPTQWKV